jgi:hypothetical protein
MSTTPPQRSIRIGDDERGGWSSDRPRPGGGPARPADLSVRCRVLRPSDRMRYSPGSLLLIASASREDRVRFADRLIENKSALLSLEKVRGLLEGRVPPEDLDARAEELLRTAAEKRLGANQTVVVPIETLDPEEREPLVRIASRLGRPRHIILLDTGREGSDEEDRGALNDLRTRLDAGELGAEGIQTALRLGGGSVSELKRIVFQSAPRED